MTRHPHTCYPLRVGNTWRATCGDHWMQQIPGPDEAKPFVPVVVKAVPS